MAYTDRTECWWTCELPLGVGNSRLNKRAAEERSLQTDGPHLLPIPRHHPITDLHTFSTSSMHLPSQVRCSCVALTGDDRVASIK